MYKNLSRKIGSRERIEITTAEKRWDFEFGSMPIQTIDVQNIDEYERLIKNDSYKYGRFQAESFKETFSMSIAELYHAIF